METTTSTTTRLEFEVTIKKIYPLASDLSSIQTNVQCTEDGCDKMFSTESNLSMHLRRHHHRQNLALDRGDNHDKHLEKHFHCPELSCVYNEKLHFSKIKYLKQHYLKVHADKHFLCTKCNKGFSTSAQRNNHYQMCGVRFTCSECANSYTSYEALMTHGRRKSHKIPEKCAFTAQTIILPGQSVLKNKWSHHKQTIGMQTINILPLIVQIKSDSVRVDKESQTEPIDVRTASRIKSVAKRRSTQQTQTLRKKPRKSAETQTMGDCILKRAIQEANICIETQTKTSNETQTKTSGWDKAEGDKDVTYATHKCTETQTKTAATKTEEHCSTSTSLCTFIENENIMHSSAQTNLNNLNFCEYSNCNSETQTDVIYQDDFIQPSVFMSHIETQTQTSDEDYGLDFSTLLPDPDLEFSNIQTQTAWPDYDMFVSTETQTLLTHNTRSLLDQALAARTHMETQTDIMEFKQLLEEINA